VDDSSFTSRFLRPFEADCGKAGGKLTVGSLSSLGRDGAGSGGLLFDGGRGGRGGSGGRLLPDGGLLLDVDVGFGGRIMSSDPPLDVGGSGLLDTCFITGSVSTLFSLLVSSFGSNARFDEFRLLKLLMLIDRAVERGRPRFFTSFPLSSSSQPRYSVTVGSALDLEGVD